ncbi:MAG: AAA family ATPase [Bacteroidota bacterium]
MSKLNPSGGGHFSEINLKHFFQKIYDRRLLFAASLLFFLALAYGFLKVADPIYEIQSTLLIDNNDITRMQENSKYVDGGIRLAETEQNIFNEIGILQSYALIEQTLSELDYGVSYYVGSWPRIRENYGDFPFTVEVLEGRNQLPGIRFELAPVNDREFRLLANAKEPEVYKAAKATYVKIDQPLSFEQTFQYGDTIRHDYFNFVIHPAADDALVAGFEGRQLFFETNQLEDLARTWQSKLEVNQLDLQSSIIQLSIRGEVPEKEIKFINLLVDNYINNKSNQRNDLVAGKEDFIRSQLETVTSDLAKAEKSMESFRKGANAIDLQKTASISLEELQQLESEKSQIELNLDYYFSLLKYLGESENFDKIMAPSVVGINDPLLNENLIELKRLNSERTRLQFYKGEKSYDLEILDKQIRGTAITLQENLKNLMTSSKMALAEKKKRIARLEQTLESLPGNEQQLVNYERKSSLYENLYNYLNQELAKTEIASARKDNNTRVLDEARMVGSGPVFPQKMLIMALAGIFGLLFPTAWMVVADTFKEQIENKNELEARSSITVAATIAHLPRRSMFFADKAKWSVEESFRDLAANLNFLVPDRNKNVIGFSSLMAGEGKSFCAVNLAFSLATAGKKTLLIDTDFRKPSMLNPENEGKEKGLSDFLKDSLYGINDIIRQHPSQDQLYYIPTQREMGNPQELFMSQRLPLLLETARKEFDYVIIDSPAVGLVSDYLLISPLIDVHLFVLRRNFSKMAFVSEYEELRRKGNMQHAFFVLNDVPRGSMKYGNSYYNKLDDNNKSVVLRSIND